MKKILSSLFLAIILPIVCNAQNYTVGEQTVNYTDSSRNRPIKVELWYPTNETDPTGTRVTTLPFVLSSTIRNAAFIRQSFPLILLSHGTGGNRMGLAWLAIALAKQGYVVAAPDHWGNTYDNKIPEYFVRYWERPLDISFILSQLIADSRFSEYINKERIGMAGFSFGGYTSLALAGAELNCELLRSRAEEKEYAKEFNVPELGDLRKLVASIDCNRVPMQSFKENRIKAFVAFAPALGSGFVDLEQTKHIDSPVLIFGAENDQIAPIKTNAENYRNLISNSGFIKLEGKVGHYIFLNEGDENLKKVAKKFYKDDDTIDRKSIHENVEQKTIAFFNQTLR